MCIEPLAAYLHQLFQRCAVLWWICGGTAATSNSRVLAIVLNPRGIENPPPPWQEPAEREPIQHYHRRSRPPSAPQTCSGWQPPTLLIIVTFPINYLRVLLSQSYPPTRQTCKWCLSDLACTCLALINSLSCSCLTALEYKLLSVLDCHFEGQVILLPTVKHTVELILPTVEDIPRFRSFIAAKRIWLSRSGSNLSGNNHSHRSTSKLLTVTHSYRCRLAPRSSSTSSLRVGLCRLYHFAVFFFFILFA